ncbi:hypothetical protein HYFRA_00004777 [Hymenoscyphus fraxineus]|uniref:RNA polymerase II subunit B1 CTD phosphatase RPAP2 homolog n=1 Tax=Hymenoscyphus fraxineus TaxID=746836 RepID=A0A9N9KK58_9HELO|nr:hypothetical protein HYFRA_00004777 [Hymenoscyphus fraxineus]
MASSQMPKSILKKKTAYPATASPQAKADRDRETAVYHANILKTRKETELDVLLSTETLLDYPTSSQPADNPSVEDATTLKELLKPFQPSDYDALIIERNIENRCGFALCPKPNRKDTSGQKFRFIGQSGRAENFKIVHTAELEKWCSEACARRALYIRVQLSESPAWEREAVESRVKIDLLDEPKTAEMTVAEDLQRLNLNDNAFQHNQQGRADLAMERGDQGFAARNGLVDVKILERNVQRQPEAPSLNEGELSGQFSNMHLALEGHTPSFDTRNKIGHDGDDEMMDWKI